MGAPPRGHVVLVGLPGAGKTTAGRAAAELLGVPFIDLDEHVSRTARASITEIFAAQGEAAFRRLEHEATVALSSRAASVVAVGGGWVESEGNAQVLPAGSFTVFVRVSPGLCATRLSGDKEHGRPLLEGADLEGRLRQLHTRREALYRHADETLEAEELSPQQVAERIRELALRRWGLLG